MLINRYRFGQGGDRISEVLCMGPCLAMLMTVTLDIGCLLGSGRGREKHKSKGAKAVCPTVWLAWQCCEDMELDK